jgi:hypothetical protein
MVGRLHEWLGDRVAELVAENAEKASILEDKLKDSDINGAKKLLERIKVGLMIPGQVAGNIAMMPGHLLSKIDNPIAQNIGAATAIPGYVMAKYPRTVGLPVIGAAGYAGVNMLMGDGNESEKQKYQDVNENIPNAQKVNTSASIDPAASAGLTKEQQAQLQQQAEMEYRQQVQAQLEEQYKKNLMKQKKESEQGRAIADGYGI